MINRKFLLFMTMATMLFIGTAHALPLPGTITYTPASAARTIPGGGQDTVSIAFDIINDTGITYLLFAADTMAEGNLPIEWISPRGVASQKFLVPGTPKTVVFTVSVPQDTPAGTYSGILMARATGAHGTADAGTGVALSVTIPAPCSSVGYFTIDSFGPAILWPPNRSMTNVTVSGTATIPDGCSLLEAGYSIDDEYGVYTSTGTLQIEKNGSFTVAIPVEAWRSGRDKNGRHYAIQLFIRDEAGINASATLYVVVPHDMHVQEQHGPPPKK